MSDFQNIKRVLLPALKGLPIIIVCFIIALVFAYRSVLYSNPVFECTAKIKLDDIDQGASSSNLYKDFDVFSNTNKIAGEVEVISSKMLIEKTLAELDFDVSYYRVGKFRTAELYHDSPFEVVYEAENFDWYDKFFTLFIHSKEEFTLQYMHRGAIKSLKASFGQEIKSKKGMFTILRNDTVIDEKYNFQLVDQYQFKIHSIEALTMSMQGLLDVTAVDKDVAVIRITAKSEIPEKASSFVNAHARVYVHDHIQNKTKAAGKTVRFIDDQLAKVSAKLKASEMAIENYRLAHDIINTRQETETDLRKISQLKIQLANLEMNQAALDTILRYVSDDSKDFLDLAPNFEAFTDLLSTELVKQIKQYQAEKKHLLLKYTEDEDKVKLVDKKLEDIISYLKESIANTNRNMHIKRREIARTIRVAEQGFEGLPTKERNMIVLQRDFALNEKMFKFLTEKRTEAAIVEAANISFHRVIQRAFTPTIAISPKKTLVMIVSGLLGLIIAISFIYVRQFIGGKVRGRIDLEKMVTAPIAGIVRQHKVWTEEVLDDFNTIATHANMKGVEKGQVIQISSSLLNEGKTYVAMHLSHAYAMLGWKVVVVDMNFRAPKLHEFLGDETMTKGISEVILGQVDVGEVIQDTSEANLYFIATGELIDDPLLLINHDNTKPLIDALKSFYDLVIIDSPATTITLDGVKLMKLCEHVFYLVKSNFTKSHYLMNAELLMEEYAIDNIRVLLNGVHKATNYNGVYTGSRFNYKVRNLGFIGKVIHYIKMYL